MRDGAMSNESVRAFHAMLAPENHQRWLDSLCEARGGSKRCSCFRHMLARSLRRRDWPSRTQYDPADPAFAALYCDACDLIMEHDREIHEQHAKRAATWLALEFYCGRPL